MRPWPIRTVLTFLIALILAVPAPARQRNVGPSGALYRLVQGSAGPRPNAALRAAKVVAPGLSPARGGAPTLRSALGLFQARGPDQTFTESQPGKTYEVRLWEEFGLRPTRLTNPFSKRVENLAVAL